MITEWIRLKSFLQYGWPKIKLRIPSFLESTSHTIINLLARIVERDLDCKLYFQILWILKNDCFQHLPGLGLFLLQIESLSLFRIRVPAEIKKFR